MTDRLSGAFIEIHIVSDFGGTETETKIGVTRDDVTIGMNPNTIETRIHGKGRREARGIGDAPTLGFSGLVVSSLQALTDLGVLDGSSKLTGTVQVDDAVAASPGALRLKVFESEGDASAKQEWAFEDVTLTVGNITYPGEDFANWEASALIAGDITKET